MPRNFLGGLVQRDEDLGPNINISRDGFHMDVDKCQDMIVVGRRYFLENIGFLQQWALDMEEKEKENES